MGPVSVRWRVHAGLLLVVYAWLALTAWYDGWWAGREVGNHAASFAIVLCVALLILGVMGVRKALLVGAALQVAFLPAGFSHLKPDFGVAAALAVDILVIGCAAVVWMVTYYAGRGASGVSSASAPAGVSGPPGREAESGTSSDEEALEGRSDARPAGWHLPWYVQGYAEIVAAVSLIGIGVSGGLLVAFVVSLFLHPPSSEEYAHYDPAVGLGVVASWLGMAICLWRAAKGLSRHETKALYGLFIIAVGGVVLLFAATAHYAEGSSMLAQGVILLCGPLAVLAAVNWKRHR